MNFQRLYEYRFRDVDQSARVDVWQEIARHVFVELGRPARVLDPAAGRGEFINAVPAAERWAVDAVAYAEGTYAAGVSSVVSDIFTADLPAGFFDGVFVSNFLEHLPTQEAVATFLERMREAMAPGGRIAIIDFSKDWPAGHESMIYKLADLEGWMKAAGFKRVAQHDFLDNNFFVVYQ